MAKINSTGGSGGSWPIFGPIQKTSDGGYLVGMSSASPAGRDKSEDAIESSLDFWIVKLAGDGTKMWDKTIGGVNFDELKSIQQTPDEGYLLGGNSFSDTGAHKSEDSRGSNDYWIVKVDKDGTKVWDKTIGAPDYDNLISANQTTDGGYILAGSSDSNIGGDKTEGTNPRAYWIVKLSPLREVEWDRSLSGLRVEGSDYQCDLTSLIQTSDGGYLAGGYSRSMAGFEKSEDSKSSLDFWIVKLAPDGTKVWDKTIGSTGTDEMASVAETLDGGYILGGSSSGGADGDKSDISQGTDYWIVKLGPDTSLPVTLANFKAQKENTTAYLTWQTTSETRSDRFEVEHSLTGKTWKSIGTVRSKGESSDVVNYQFVHSDPVGGVNNMYRLKMVDLDKTFAYSSIKTLKFETAVKFEIYPNPVFDVLKIETNGLKSVSAIGIYNSAGRQVYKSGALVKSEIDLKGLSAGLYVLKIWNKDGSEIAKNIVVGR